MNILCRVVVRVRVRFRIRFRVSVKVRVRFRVNIHKISWIPWSLIVVRDCRMFVDRKFISQELKIKILERHTRSDSESYMR